MSETAYERVITAMQAHGGTVKERHGGGKADATCPAHQDHNPSVSITGTIDGVLVHCHAGCAIDDVLAALDLTKSDLFDEKATLYRYDDGRTIKRSYDDRGKKRFVKVADGADNARRALYHLAQLQATPPGRTVFLVEGERDVHAIEAAGGVATTGPHGAESFHLVDVSPLAAHRLTVVVDRDAAGDKWAAQVYAKLNGVVQERPTFVQAAEGKDAADHIAAGHGLNDWEPYEPPTPSEATSEATSEGRIIRFRAASGIKMTRTRWLHGHERGGHIPLGAITLLAGREGIGKSTISYDVIAKVTTGTLRGEFYGTPKGVVIYATEDDWEPVILPRLIAAGADATRVFRADAYDEDGSKDWLSFPRDLVRLAEQCLEHDVALLVLDPIMSIIDGKLDTHKDREVRQALDPLSRFAAAAGVAVAGLIHVNKSGGSDALNSVMGSRAFSAVARSVLYCIAVPKTDDEDAPDEYLFSQEKCNLGPKQGSQRYQITTVALDGEDEDGESFKVYTSKVVWGATDSRRAGDVMEEANKVGRAKGDLRTELAAWLRERDDMVPVREIHDEFQSRAKRGSIDTTLSRMVTAGEIERPVNGMYRARSKQTV